MEDLRERGRGERERERESSNPAAFMATMSLCVLLHGNSFTIWSGFSELGFDHFVCIVATVSRLFKIL